MCPESAFEDFSDRSVGRYQYEYSYAAFGETPPG
eukprot:COSAG04_NODE_24418_length_322_cov_0.901345_1_plen_33_part_01